MLKTMSTQSEQPPSKDMEMDERGLLEKARLGDEEAFLALYRSHSPRVFRLLWAMLRDRHQAEDGTQEVFVKVHGRLGAFRAESRFSTWLYRIAVNTAIDMKRKAFLRSWLPLFSPEVREPKAPEVPVEGEGAIPESLWKELSVSQRAVVELRVVQELSVAEAAEALGVSEGTVKTQLHRALKKLRFFLSTPPPEGGG